MDGRNVDMTRSSRGNSLQKEGRRKILTQSPSTPRLAERRCTGVFFFKCLDLPLTREHTPCCPIPSHLFPLPASSRLISALMPLSPSESALPALVVFVHIVSVIAVWRLRQNRSDGKRFDNGSKLEDLGGS